MGTLVQTKPLADRGTCIRLVPGPLSVRDGRQRFRETVVEADDKIDQDNLFFMDLALCELLTNVVRHTSSKQCLILLVWSESQIIVGVYDEDPHRMPVVPTPDDLGLGGRGLGLVEGLAARWGCYVCRGGAGKIVWAKFVRTWV